MVEFFCNSTIIFSSSGIFSVRVLALGVILVTSPMTVTSLLVYFGVCELIIRVVALDGCDILSGKFSWLEQDMICVNIVVN